MEVTGPDGMILSFPANTPQDIMREALEKRYGAPRPNTGDLPRAFVREEQTSGETPPKASVANIRRTRLCRQCLPSPR